MFKSTGQNYFQDYEQLQKEDLEKVKQIQNLNKLHNSQHLQAPKANARPYSPAQLSPRVPNLPSERDAPSPIGSDQPNSIT